MHCSLGLQLRPLVRRWGLRRPTVEVQSAESTETGSTSVGSSISDDSVFDSTPDGVRSHDFSFAGGDRCEVFSFPSSSTRSSGDRSEGVIHSGTLQWPIYGHFEVLQQACLDSLAEDLDYFFAEIQGTDYARTFSLGSIEHGPGKCEPCRFVDSFSGCCNGWRCQFCHLPHDHPHTSSLQPLRSELELLLKMLATLVGMIRSDPDLANTRMARFAAQRFAIQTRYAEAIQNTRAWRSEGSESLSDTVSSCSSTTSRSEANYVESSSSCLSFGEQVMRIEALTRASTKVSL